MSTSLLEDTFDGLTVFILWVILLFITLITVSYAQNRSDMDRFVIQRQYERQLFFDITADQIAHDTQLKYAIIKELKK